LLVALLLWEWRYFYAQAHQLYELKEDYRNYTSSVKKILHDYNKTKERLDLLENSLENEKKNGLNESSERFTFSSDVQAQDDQFVLVNRDFPYLRQSTIRFMAREYNDIVCSLPDDALFDYCEVALKSIKADSQKEKKFPPVYHQQTIKKKRKTNGTPISSDIVFSWPVERSKFWLSSLFGSRTRTNGTPGFHFGVDMAAFRGTPVRAAASGIVMEARYARGYGKTIVIAHNRKYKTRYAHLDKICVSVGKKVRNRELIGYVGDTGNVRSSGTDGSHLHFEVLTYNRHVNPLYFLSN